MSSWPPIESLRALDLELAGPLSPREVLYDFDGPCIFTALTPAETLVLAYLSEDLEDEALLRYIVATTSETTVAAMKEGVVSVREALGRGSLWLVDVDYHRAPQRAFKVHLDDLPDDALPIAGTMLWPSLEPALVVRLEGPEIKWGRIPAPVMTQAAEIAGKALKPLFEWAARAWRKETNTGRPPEWLRYFYALPAQRFAPGSLEVAFRDVDRSAAQVTLPFDDPSFPTPEEIHESGWRALREGLDWAVSNGDASIEAGEEEKWLAILEAMKRMAPGSAGPVTSVAISGRLVGRATTPFELDRSAAKRIRATLTSLKTRHDVQLRIFTGLIRDLDLDKLTMILRDVPDESADVQLSMEDPQLLETAREAHYQELPVSVAARSTDRKNWTAVEVEFLQREEPTP